MSRDESAELRLPNGVGTSNGERHREGQLGLPPLRWGWARATVQDFSPLWFTWVMNTGALALLLHQQPYQFPHIRLLSTILFLLALTLFVLFSLLFLARLALFRRTAYTELTTDINELTFIPCWTIALMTLTSLVALIATPTTWGGRPLALLAYTLWWFVMAWNGATLLWAFTVLIRAHETSPRRLPASIIIPAVSTSTVAVTGAIVSLYAEGLSPRLAVPVIVVSFHWLGVGVLLGLLLYGFLFHALLAQGWPPPAATPSMFILVGPMGQSAAALQFLGMSASGAGRFADYPGGGTVFTAAGAGALDGACVLWALLFNGLGVVWLAFAVVAMADRARKRELSWSPAWNAIIFPTATLTTSMIGFAVQMDSAAYRVVAAGLTVGLVLVWVVNVGFTVVRVGQGKLLVVREDWRVRRRLEEGKER